jgi:hypothetical protein
MLLCLGKYRNSVTNLFSPAFQQLKSIGFGIYYRKFSISKKILSISKKTQNSELKITGDGSPVKITSQLLDFGLVKICF